MKQLYLFQVTHSPNPTEKDIKFILDEVRHYLTSDLDVRRADVQSAWSGIRPLVKDPNAKDTQSLVSLMLCGLLRTLRLKMLISDEYSKNQKYDHILRFEIT